MSKHNSYHWHDGHTSHHSGLQKDEHPNTMAHGPMGNDQAAGVGSKDYSRMAAPYGTVTKGVKTDLKFYPLDGKHQAATQQVAQNGYQTYYAGGHHGKPDLATKNYNTKHLMIYDPSAGSGGDFGDTSYTDAWRKTHELAHALTYGDLNKMYGEGRRIGALGKQRTPREAKRAVHWEWLVVHKQRELAKQLGVHISDEDFHKEVNTVMHDAVHRAVTGKFSEPGDEGFNPHPHKVPLETALGIVDSESRKLGLRHDDDLLQKSSSDFCIDPAALNLSDTNWSQMDIKSLKSELAKSLRIAVETHTKTTSDLIDSENRGLKRLNKADDVEKCGEITKSDNDDVEAAADTSCPGCGSESNVLGTMGWREHFMCKGCGLTHSKGLDSFQSTKASTAKTVRTAQKESGRKPVHKDELPATEAVAEKPRDGAVLPGDKKSKVVEAEGAGGDVSKGKMAKAEFIRKPAADDSTAPVSGGEKKAAGIGFLNGLISKYHGKGNETWAAMGSQAPVSYQTPTPSSVARRTGQRMALAEMPHQNDGAGMQSNGTTIPMGKAESIQEKATRLGKERYSAGHAAGTKAKGAHSSIFTGTKNKDYDRGYTHGVKGEPHEFKKDEIPMDKTTAPEADKEIRGFKSIFNNPTAFPKGKMSFTGGHTSVAGADKEIQGFKSLGLKPPMMKDEIPSAPKAPTSKAPKPPKVAAVPTPQSPKVEGPKAPGGAPAMKSEKTSKKSK